MGNGFNNGPNNLWTLARQFANQGIDLDTTVVMIQGDTVNYGYTNVTSDFGRNIRDQFGIPYNQYVNVDGYSPDELSLDLFAADDLIRDFGRMRMRYYGYDYLGNQLGTDVTFDDFFTARDANGVYATQSAGETSNISHPGTIGNEFVVYGNQEASTVSAYRDGEQWYDATGTAVNDPTTIFGSLRPTPYFDNPNDLAIQVDGFSPTGFVDYEPQITVMPRISFSFPLSENSGFFAHYDVLSRRPTQTYATALDLCLSCRYLFYF